ncbi:right-handed parallel beta-helix repeat-containing protein [Xanthomonas sp. Kuri4-1]
MRKQWAGWAVVAWMLCGPATAQAYQVYLSPTGDDAAAGTQAAPLRSLQGVLEKVAGGPAGEDVDVVVAPGTYSGQSVVWNYVGARSITFAPPTDADAMPVFDGQGGGTWFALRGAKGKATAVSFIGLHVRNYWMAIDLGSSNAAKDANSGNAIQQMYFERIGGIYGTGAESYSYAAVRLQNSSGNRIDGNRFEHVENTEDRSGYIHALYLAHGSADNVVAGNAFTDVNGDAVRTRNRSDGTVVDGNTFVRAGKYAAFSDWFDAASGECPSQGGRFVDNHVGAGYFGTIPATATTGADDACGALELPRISEEDTVRD